MQDDTGAPPPSAPQPRGPGLRERFPDLVRDFRRIASRMLRKLPAPSLVSDELVSEGFLRLMREETKRLLNNRSDLGGKPDAILKACFGVACRDVMSMRWRKRVVRRETRPAKDSDLHDLRQHDLADVDDLLEVLAAAKPEIAEVVELIVFGDLTIAECAELLGVSPSTIDRAWRVGKAWIKTQLGGTDDD